MCNIAIEKKMNWEKMKQIMYRYCKVLVESNKIHTKYIDLFISFHRIIIHK